MLRKSGSSLLALFSLLAVTQASGQSTASFLNNLQCSGSCMSTTTVFPSSAAASSAYPSPLDRRELSASYLPAGASYRGLDENYSVVAGGDFIVPDTGGINVEGRVAIGGDLVINRIGYGMAQSSSGSFLVGKGGGAASPAVAVGGTISGSGSLGVGYNAGGTYAVRSAGVNTLTAEGGSTGQFAASGSGSSGINITAIISGMQKISANMLGTAPTGTISGSGPTLNKKYIGSSSALEVFTVVNRRIPTTTTDSLFFTNITAGATVVVNVTDTGALTVNWTPHIGRAADPATSAEPDAQVFNVVWNFPNARSVRFRKTMIGTVLIPKGDAILEQAFYGRLCVSGSITHAAAQSIHNYPFTGDLSQFNRLTITGHVFNDANGMTDSLVNKTSDKLGGLLTSDDYWVNLFNNSGKVVKATLLKENLYYKFDSLTAGTYFVQLSAHAGIPGADTPATGHFRLSWVFTGEQLGIGKGSDGWANGLLAVGAISTTSIPNANFGLNCPPYPAFTNIYIASPSSGDLITLDGIAGNPDVPYGEDLEDGTLGFGHTLAIRELPTTSTLLYNGLPLKVRDTILSFNPSLLQLKIGSYSRGATNTSFKYTFLDIAGIGDIYNGTQYKLHWDTPLPLELLRFDAHAKDQQALLDWSTAAEDKIEAYHIEWSTNGIQYQEIGSLKANNGQDLKKNYHFEATSFVTGNNLYRLRIAGTDGTSEYSPVRSLQKGKNEMTTAVRVYPNPSAEVLNVDGLQNGALLQLYNPAGTKVLEQRAAQANESLRLGNLPAGMYTLLVGDNNTSAQFKITKY